MIDTNSPLSPQPSLESSYSKASPFEPKRSLFSKWRRTSPTVVGNTDSKEEKVVKAAKALSESQKEERGRLSPKSPTQFLSKFSPRTSTSPSKQTEEMTKRVAREVLKALWSDVQNGNVNSAQAESYKATLGKLLKRLPEDQSGIVYEIQGMQSTLHMMFPSDKEEGERYEPENKKLGPGSILEFDVRKITSDTPSKGALLDDGAKSTDGSTPLILGKELGRGASGVTYDTNNPNIVVKVFEKPINPQEEDPRMGSYKGEILVVGLRHENIMKAYQCFFNAEGHMTAIVLEKASGEPLAKVLQEGESLDLETKFNLMLQLIESMAYLQSVSVLQEDLNTGNIMVDGDKLKLIDFGLATRPSVMKDEDIRELLNKGLLEKEKAGIYRYRNQEGDVYTQSHWEFLCKNNAMTVGRNLYFLMMQGRICEKKSNFTPEETLLLEQLKKDTLSVEDQLRVRYNQFLSKQIDAETLFQGASLEERALLDDFLCPFLQRNWKEIPSLDEACRTGTIKLRQLFSNPLSSLEASEEGSFTESESDDETLSSLEAAAEDKGLASEITIGELPESLTRTSSSRTLEGSERTPSPEVLLEEKSFRAKMARVFKRASSR